MTDKKTYIYNGEIYQSNEALLAALERNGQIGLESSYFSNCFPLNDHGLVQYSKEAVLMMLSTFYRFNSKEVMVLALEALTGYSIADCKRIIDSTEFQKFLQEFNHNKYIRIE